MFFVHFNDYISVCGNVILEVRWVVHAVNAMISMLYWMTYFNKLGYALMNNNKEWYDWQWLTGSEINSKEYVT